MDDTTIDLRDILKTLRKRKTIIIRIFLAMVISTAVISMLIPPTYEGETTIRVKQPKGLGDSLFAGISGGSFNAKQLMSTYAEIVKSRTVVQKVIDELPVEEGKQPPKYEGFVGMITTQPVRDTEILKIKVQAKSPEGAQQVTNLLVQTFIERLTELVRLEQRTVREFIGQRLKEAKTELEQAEIQLEHYKQQEKIVDPGEETKALMDKLTTLDKQMAENSVGLAAAEARLDSVRQQLGSQNAGFIADSPLVQKYKATLADLEIQLVTLSQNYTDKHPKVQAVQAGIKETKEALNTEIQRIVQAQAPSSNPIFQVLIQGRMESEAELAVRTARKQAIAQIVREGEKGLDSLPTKERGLAQVLRAAKVSQEIYVMLAKRHEEARIAEVMEPTEVQIVDAAVAPNRPIAPRKALNVVIAAILGLMIGVGAAFLQEYLNRSIQTADDVKAYLGLPVLGKIPHFDAEQQRDEQEKKHWINRLRALAGLKPRKRHRGSYYGYE